MLLRTPTIRLRKQHGKGKFVYRSGNVYEGDWSNDVPHGKGTFVEGTVIYDIEPSGKRVCMLGDTFLHVDMQNVRFACGCGGIYPQ